MAEEEVPSPKFHNHAEAAGVVKSKKLMRVFAQVLVGVAENFANGLSFTIIPLVIPALSVQPPAVTIISDIG